MSKLLRHLALLGLVIGGALSSFALRSQHPSVLPDLSLHDLSGRRVDLSSFRGRVVLLNVWATWCVPCEREMPTLETLGRRVGNPDFAVVTVSADEKSWKVASWIQDRGFTLPVLLDPDSRLTRALKIRAYPESFLVDRSGRIVHHHEGFRDWSSSDVVRAVTTLVRYGTWAEPGPAAG